MPCMCFGHSVTALHAGSAGIHLAENRKGSRVASTSLRAHHQLPGPACTSMRTLAQCTTPADRRSRCAGRRPARRSVCKAQEQEEKEKDMVGGFDVDAPAGFLESEAVGIVFKVGFVLFVSAGVAAILLLAKPVINNTIQVFPYRTSGGGETGTAGESAAEPKSLIPGLDSGSSQGSGDSIFD